ncbi:MAG: matrixin family metalloprotease [Archangium sp.]
MVRFALLSALVAVNALAFDLRTDSEGDVVKWTHSLELTIDARLADQLGASNAIEAVQRAVAHVDEATPGLDVTATIGEAKPIGFTLGASDNTNSILALDEWPYSERALAVTLVTINARTNELLDADVAFNVDEHRFKVLSDLPNQGYAFDDVQNTITHELGHVLGLMHNSGVQDLVMYPSAPPGEILKRQLKQDDRDGLLTLYTDPVGPALQQPLPAQGCSATSSTSPMFAAFGAVMLLLLRRKRTASLQLVRAAKVSAVVLAAAVPLTAQAADPKASLETADDVAIVLVATRESFVHPQKPGLIFTRITLSAPECAKGSCGTLQTVIVPGGRVGDLEQVVVHEPVPMLGERVVVTRKAGVSRVLQLEPVERASVIQRLRESISTATAASPTPGTAQVPATTR